MSKNYYRSIWISDVHLGTKDCKAELLLNFLDNVSCDTLYLVGDIIDGWRMKSNLYFPQAHVNVVRKFLSKARKGTRVIYIAGNHDEFLRNYTELSLAFGNLQIVNEYTHVTANNKKLLIVHGDAFDGITRYHKWIAFMGDTAYGLLLTVNSIFNKIRAKFGLGYWSLSAYLKHKVKQAVNFICEFENAVIYECKHRKFDGIVCGHIHHPEIKVLDTVTYYNCGDWVESCTALVEDDNGKITIVRWLDNK